MPTWTRRRLSLILLATLLGLLLAAGSSADDGLARVAFLAVGQGDAILVQDGHGFDALIDGGRPAAGPTVVAYLQAQQVDDLEVLLATHADADHIGGLLDVLASDLPVEAALYNGYPGDSATWEAFLAALATRGLTPTPLHAPDTLVWGDFSVQVLNPEKALPSPEQNAASVVLLLTHGQVDWLLTGDIDATVEAKLVEQGASVAAEVLKVAHHGSAYGSGDAWLAAVQPQVALVSVGRNGYGHPSPETLERLLAAGAHIWRTDERGTIVVTSDGVAYQVWQSPTGMRLPAVWR